MTGVREPLVHGLNKTIIVTSRAEYFAKFDSRCNIVLVGDSLADAEMAAALPNAKNVLKVGFLVQEVSYSWQK